MEIDMNKKRAWFDQTGTLFVLGFTAPEKLILEAFYEVLHTIGKTRAPFNSGETLIKPTTLKISEIFLGQEAIKKIKQVLLPNDEVTLQIAEMSCNIVDPVVTAIKESLVRISLQLDESTDVSNTSHLLSKLQTVTLFRPIRSLQCSW